MNKLKIIILIVSLFFLPCLSYSGCIDGDCINGHGTFIFTGGEKYVGEFKNGERDGRGTYTFPSGKRLVGQWKLGKPVGE